MAMTAALASQPQAVQIDYTYRGVFSEGGYRVDDDCLVTPALVRQFGWRVAGGAEVADVEAEGRQLKLPYKRLDGKTLLSLTEAVRQLGARALWDPDTKAYTVRGWVRNVERTPTGLRVDSTLAALPRVHQMKNPVRLVLDLQGAELHRPAVEGLPAGWRAAQYHPDVVRVVVEGVAPAGGTPKLDADRTFRLDLKAQEAPAATVSDDPPAPHSNEAPAMEAYAPLAVVSAPRLAGTSAENELIALPFSGTLDAGPTASYLGPTTIELVLVGARPSENALKAGLQTAFVKSAKSTGDDRGNAHVVFELQRPAAFQVNLAPGHVQLQLVHPAASDGKLEGKVVVIDPGHGGKDTGAKCASVCEKDLNLAVGRMVARELTKAGLSVVMTRNDDRAVGLKERSEMANRARADLFVSIHTNSNRTAGSTSGSITFFHKQDPAGMLLAECIQDEIEKLTAVPSLGTWSDGRIYQSGFAVLRNSTMPSVLIEMGFINHGSDRKALTTEAHQRALAKAILKGLKVYIGDAKKE